MPVPDAAHHLDGRIGVSEWTLREARTEDALRRIVVAGFGAVELVCTPQVDIQANARTLADSGLVAVAICPIYGASRSFAAAEAVHRRAAADLLRHSIDYATAVGAGIVIVVPDDSPTAVHGSPADARKRAAETIRSVAADLAPGGPTVVLEPLNRYESSLVTTLGGALELCHAVGSEKVAAMADAFHMNIEESNPSQAIRDAGSHLRHVHLADNHRREPGSGRLDFGALLDDLRAVAYRGALVVESIPATDAGLAAGLRYLTALLEQGNR